MQLDSDNQGFKNKIPKAKLFDNYFNLLVIIS